ncbi:MAG: NAD(P)-dependent alcohol dehydrogenase, partial [Armatimonadetes bacterium]|nr:NAD(P)-dependent alcohol dehydrogenase [Armatimonadota bacterium]
IGLAQSGKANLSALVTHRFPLEDLAGAFRLLEDYSDGVIKPVVTL